METKSDESSLTQQIEEKVRIITGLRQRPLLLLYYPFKVSITEIDIQHLKLILKSHNIGRWNALDHLDVLLHTVGGDPITSYRLAQRIRDTGRSVDFLVPQHAFSGGTLMSLCANTIWLGDGAVLSPFDITLVHRDAASQTDDDSFPEETPEEEIELVAIDHFIQVAKQARIEIERGFRQRGWKLSRTDVESQMLCEMVRQMGVLPVAHYYREKNIAQEYATELLTRYMFVDGMRPGVLDKILRRLIVEAPSHEFPMDFHICDDIGLKVTEMDGNLSEACQDLIELLDRAPPDPEVFMEVAGRRLPLFQFFTYNPAQPVPETTVSAENGAQAPDEASPVEHGRNEAVEGISSDEPAATE